MREADLAKLCQFLLFIAAQYFMPNLLSPAFYATSTASTALDNQHEKYIAESPVKLWTGFGNIVGDMVKLTAEQGGGISSRLAVKKETKLR
ncbi:hypothetical protein MNY66_12230 [Moellerella wisconsensis]|uniref:Uncharacterized protein n=1 Tax=Moellerella wisconsensis TaxID=158849 RepID=A0ACD3Y581_9GAMM|nr:hypothetical protein [Moellerella wisconsensis]UNH38287.1 hypothetical protein MNY70_12495 [Moellerella wisconsensis]UNH41800.1 hypothetical protein MNY66_12230 [Moellerella wisconsensis]